MRRKSLLSLSLALGLAGSGLAQTVDPGYAVATWRGFRSAAVTHTFDDNDPNQLAVAVPMFDEHGFRLTLFTMTDAWRPANWPGLAEAAARGHEIASHTVTHARLSELSSARQTFELQDSQGAIRARIPVPEGMTLAYPFCAPGDVSITRAYYLAARGCQGSVERSTPLDLMNVSSIIVGSEGPVRSAAHLNARAEEATASSGWAVFLIHGIDGDGGWSPVSSVELRKHLEYLKANEERFWVETFGDVVRYLRERDAVTIREVSAGEDAVVVQVTDTLDDAVYDHPITIRRALPHGWASASATQDGRVIPSGVVEAEGRRHVVFDAVPDGGEVVLARSRATGARPDEAGARVYRGEAEGGVASGPLFLAR